MIFNSTFDGPIPERARALHLYGLPAGNAVTHTGTEPLPPHVTIDLG
jgi:hypothetical protein